MKIEIIETPKQQDEPIKYPILAKSINTDQTVLFLTSCQGIELKPNVLYYYTYFAATDTRHWRIIPPGSQVIFTQE